MFGHGQIEGFTEKYGMEYQRPRYDETPDHVAGGTASARDCSAAEAALALRGESQLPALRLLRASGSVDENVFAYSNRAGNERALVVYNNRYGETHGTIHNSAAYADKGSAQLRQKRIHDGLGFAPGSGALLSYRDSLTGLEFLRRANDVAEHGLTFHLHAYQCHVLMDWHEKWASAEKPWDRLCDQLNGRGVPSLEDALIDLELQPVHQAVRALLDQDTVRLLTDMAEHPRTTAANGTVSVAIDRKINRARSELFNVTWARCEAFMRVAQLAFQSRGGQQRTMTMPGLLGPAFRERLAAAMRIPVVEALFAEPWTAAARRVLPSPSPQMTATAMWAPIIAWCALETLADSIDAENPETVALETFDQLRLRKPLAEAFASLGFEGQSSWRAAARIKIVLMAQRETANQQPELIPQPTTPPSSVPLESPGAPEEELGSRADFATKGNTARNDSVLSTPAPPSIVAGLPRALWSDPDVRWLTGVHDAGEYSYLVQEPFEELLWWLQMPALLRLAGKPSTNKSHVQAISTSIQESLAEAKSAAYKLQNLLGPVRIETSLQQDPVISATPSTEADRIGSDSNPPETSKGEEDSTVKQHE